MRLRTFPEFFCGLAALGTFGGCSPGNATVNGEVTVDGRPLDKGIISYIPADEKGAPITVTIENGRYELRTVAGNNTVQISAPVVIDKRRAHNGPDAPWIEIPKESLPEIYNSKSELKFEVIAGENVTAAILAACLFLHGIRASSKTRFPCTRKFRHAAPSR